MPKTRADRVRERVVETDERVRERETGDRRGVCHRGPRLDVGAVLVGPRQRLEDHVARLHAERVGERRGEDRDARLERVRQRVDARVGGHRRRHRHGQRRIDDRRVRHERVVDSVTFALGRG